MVFSIPSCIVYIHAIGLTNLFFRLSSLYTHVHALGSSILYLAKREHDKTNSRLSINVMGYLGNIAYKQPSYNVYRTSVNV